MAGPWEQFQSQPVASGPWEAYNVPTEKPKMLKIGAEGLPDAVKAVAGDFHPLTQMAVGAKSAWDNAAMRLKQMVGGTLTPEQEMEVRANRALLQESAPAMAGNIAAQVGALGPLNVSGVMGNAALGAGVGAMANPVLDGESGLANAAIGGVAGGIGGLAGKLMTGAPMVKPTDQTQRLLKEGVVPTIGQNAASSSSRVAQALGRAEEKASSLPVVGDFITGARRRALGEFNEAALRKAVPPGASVSQIGKEGVKEALEKTGQAFDDAYRGAIVGPSDDLVQAISAAKDKPAAGLSEEAARKFDRIMDRVVTQRLKPNMDAGLVKKTIESDLGKEARNFKFSNMSDDKALAEALTAARDAVRSVMNRAVGPENASRLVEANKAYAAGQTLKKAAESAKSEGGVFTPFQLQRAAKDGMLRPLADDAQAVLASRVPNSGTADRALQSLLFSGQFPDRGTLGYLGGGLLTAPAYSRVGSRFLLGDLTPEQVQALAPFIAQGVRGGLYGQE